MVSPSLTWWGKQCFFLARKPNNYKDSENWDEKAANCARHFFVTLPWARGPLSIFHHSSSFLIPCNTMVRSAWNNAGYTMHIYAICVWCAKRQRGLGRMVYALTRVANEVRVFMELTQPRIHCIALGNNGFANLPPVSIIRRLLPLVLVLFSVSLLARFPSPAFSGNATVPSTFVRVSGKLGFCYSCTTSIFIPCPISFLASPFQLYSLPNSSRFPIFL